MEKALYEATSVKDYPNFDAVGIKVKLRLLDGHFYDDVYFKSSFLELIKIVEKGEMLYVVKVNGDQIFINTKLIVDFVLS